MVHPHYIILVMAVVINQHVKSNDITASTQEMYRLLHKVELKHSTLDSNTVDKSEPLPHASAYINIVVGVITNILLALAKATGAQCMKVKFT